MLLPDEGVTEVNPATGLQRVETALLWVSIALIPLNFEAVLQHTEVHDDSLHRVSVTPFDVAVLVLLLLALAQAVGRFGAARPSPPVLAFLGVVATTALACTVHPSLRGAQAVVHLVEIAVLAAALERCLRSPWRRSTLVVVAAAAGAEAALGTAQVLLRHTVGLTFLGEFPPLLPFGSEVAAKGTFTHPYLLAGFATVAATALAVHAAGTGHRLRWSLYAAAAAAAAQMGLTYSRMSVVAVAVVLGVLCLPGVRWGPWLPVPAAVVTAGMLLPALATSSGWVARAHETTGAGSLDALTTNQLSLMHQAWELLAEHLWFGVGPGQYMFALEQKTGLPPEALQFPVHNVPLLLAAEGGLFVLLAVVVFFLETASWVAGSNRRTLAIAACYLPFLLLDHPVSHPQGVGVMALWLGLVSATGARERAPEQP